jgi:hypothetical protein
MSFDLYCSVLSQTVIALFATFRNSIEQKMLFTCELKELVLYCSLACAFVHKNDRNIAFVVFCSNKSSSFRIIFILEASTQFLIFFSSLLI